LLRLLLPLSSQISTRLASQQGTSPHSDTSLELIKTLNR